MSQEGAASAVPRDDAQPLAVALAAAATGCVLTMPVCLLLTGRVGTTASALAFALAFLIVFALGTVLLCRFRDAANAAVIAGAACAVAALLLGGEHLHLVIARLAAAALVAAAAIWLAFRNWRYPVYGEIGGGALALALEVLIVTGAGVDAWEAPLGVLIPVFFAASLASRLVTLWREPDVDPADARTWTDPIPVASAAFVVGVVVVAGAALRGGVFQRLGSIVMPVLSVILTVVLVILEVILSPIAWLVSRFHVNADAWEQKLRSLGGSDDATTRFQPHGAVGGTFGRIAGVALVALVIWLALRALRRVRAPQLPATSRPAPTAIARTPLPPEPEPAPERRRELPEDRVRRWYAEALLALERTHIRKDPSQTPAEFAREVGRDRPELRADLDPLTRAYEDVRYGSLALGDVTMRELRAHHRALIAALRHPPREGPATT